MSPLKFELKSGSWPNWDQSGTVVNNKGGDVRILVDGQIKWNNWTMKVRRGEFGGTFEDSFQLSSFEDSHTVTNLYSSGTSIEVRAVKVTLRNPKQRG